MMDRLQEAPSLNARLGALRNEAMEEVARLAEEERVAKERLRVARLELMESTVIAIEMGTDIPGLVKATGRSENTIRSWARMHDQPPQAETPRKVGRGKTVHEAAEDLTEDAS